MKKKILVGMFTAVCILSLVACSKENKKVEDETSNTSKTNVEVSEKGTETNAVEVSEKDTETNTVDVTLDTTLESETVKDRSHDLWQFNAHVPNGFLSGRDGKMVIIEPDYISGSATVVFYDKVKSDEIDSFDQMKYVSDNSKMFISMISSGFAEELTSELYDIETENVSVKGMDAIKYTAKIDYTNVNDENKLCYVYGYTWMYTSTNKYFKPDIPHVYAIFGFTSSPEKDGEIDVVNEMADYVMYHIERRDVD